MAYYLVNKQNPEYCLNMNKYTGSDLEKIKTDYSMDGYLYFNKFTPTEQAKNCTAFTLPSTTNHEGVWMIKGADAAFWGNNGKICLRRADSICSSALSCTARRASMCRRVACSRAQ